MDARDERRIFSVIVFSVIALVTIASSVYVFLKDEDDVKGVEIQKESTNQYPYITNLIPKTAYVGEEYIFVPKVVSSGTDRIILTITEGPEWLDVDEENIVRGYPSIDDIGTFKVVLRVQDSLGSSTMVDYIIVQENEE